MSFVRLTGTKIGLLRELWKIVVFFKLNNSCFWLNIEFNYIERALKMMNFGGTFTIKPYGIS